MMINYFNSLKSVLAQIFLFLFFFSDVFVAVWLVLCVCIDTLLFDQPRGYKIEPEIDFSFSKVLVRLETNYSLSGSEYAYISLYEGADLIALSSHVMAAPLDLAEQLTKASVEPSSQPESLSPSPTHTRLPAVIYQFDFEALNHLHVGLEYSVFVTVPKGVQVQII